MAFFAAFLLLFRKKKNNIKFLTLPLHSLNNKMHDFNLSLNIPHEVVWHFMEWIMEFFRTPKFDIARTGYPRLGVLG
jgi:hypothetical protein